MKFTFLILAALLPLASCAFTVDDRNDANRNDAELSAQPRNGGDPAHGDDRNHDDHEHCDQDGRCDQPHNQ